MFLNSHEAYNLKLSFCILLLSKIAYEWAFKALAQVRASQALLDSSYFNMEKQETDVP